MPTRGAYHETSIDDVPAPRSVAVFCTRGVETRPGLVVIVRGLVVALVPCEFDARTSYAQVMVPVHGTVAEVADVVVALANAAASIEDSTSYVTGRPPVVAEADQVREICAKVASVAAPFRFDGALGATHNTTVLLATLVPAAFVA